MSSTIFPVTLREEASAIYERQSQLLSRSVTVRSRQAIEGMQADATAFGQWAVVDTTPSRLRVKVAGPPSPEEVPSSSQAPSPALSRSSTSSSLARAKSSLSTLVRRANNISLSDFSPGSSSPDAPRSASPDLLDGSPLEFEVLTCVDPQACVPEDIWRSIKKAWGEETLMGLQFTFWPNDSRFMSTHAIEAEGQYMPQMRVEMEQGDTGWSWPILMLKRDGLLTMQVPEELCDDTVGVELTKKSKSKKSKRVRLSKTEHLQSLAETLGASPPKATAWSLVRLRKCDENTEGTNLSDFRDESTGLLIESRLPTAEDIATLFSQKEDYEAREAARKAASQRKERRPSIYSIHSQRAAHDRSRRAYDARPDTWSSSSFRERSGTLRDGAW